MNGLGFKCDACGKAVILPGVVDRYWNGSILPEGWFVLGGPTSAPDAPTTDQRHEFCSISCVASYAHKAIEAKAEAAS